MVQRQKRIAAIALVYLTFQALCFGQSTFNINLDAIRNSVVFMYLRGPDGSLKDAGTGFLLLAPSKAQPDRAYTMLVTARHIADPGWAGCLGMQGTLFAVFNTKATAGHSAGTIEIPLSSFWLYSSDDNADVAVTLLNAPLLEQNNVENLPVKVSELPHGGEDDKIDAGAQIVSAGLLLGASGARRNYPIFKFGYVSSKPDEDISVNCAPGLPQRPMKEWMISASLVAGNSGSPIYFVPVGFPGIGLSGQRPFLLGVQSMSFIGSDVAGMTPVRYLIDAMRRISFPDLDFSIFNDQLKGPTAVPSSSMPQSAPVATPTGPPLQKDRQ